MRKGVSIREFARRDGCAESLVRRHAKSGLLPTFEDGSIDPELIGSDWRKSARQGAHTTAHTAHKGAHTDAPRVRTPEPAPIAPHSRAEAERIRENVRTARETLELEKLRGSLVDREEAERAIFGRARAERDAWLNWPLRIAGDMAAELGVKEAALLTVLKREVLAHLTELAKTPDLKLASEPDADE